jgi:ribosome-associated toxin RatA of RatAB toxin-antitoxin module
MEEATRARGNYRQPRVEEKPMPVVETEAIIPAPPERVYAAAKQIERFPEFMPNVQQVEIVERDGPRVVSRWVAYIEEFSRTIKWTEEDEWNDDTRVCAFRATEGDWDNYDGVWGFEEHPQGTRAYIKLDFEFNVPLIGPLIKGLLKKLVKRNADDTLEGIARMAAAE